MALTNIFTGMSQGPEAIDANFKTLDGSSPKIITDWSSDGISYKNGCTVNGDQNFAIQYQITKLGGPKILFIKGYFNAPALDFNQKIVAFTLPMNVVSQVDTFGVIIGRYVIPWGDTLFQYDLDVKTGDFSLHNESSRADAHITPGAYDVYYGKWV